MRILICATSLRATYGGPAFSVPRLTVALAEAGCEVGLWVADQSLPEDVPPSKIAGVSRFSMSLARVFESFGPDLVHDNGLWLRHHHVLAVAARARNIPRVVSTRGMLEPWAFRHKGGKKRIAWMLYQHRDLVTACALHTTAKSEADHLKQFALGPPIWTIPNGIDMPPLHSSDHNSQHGHALTALFLGRLYPVKGLPMLIEAWARVRPQGWRLVIAGPDESGHLRELEGAVAATRLDDVVSFAGALFDDKKTMALYDADLFILPSHSESFGMAIAEALAHGLPVLTTTAAPWPMIESRGCGWRVVPTVEGIEAGLRCATACKCETLRAMGASGRALIAEEFGWARVVKDFVSLYSQLLRVQGAKP